MTLQHGKLKPHIGGHLLLPRNKSYCVIGDLHGRIDTLEKIVSKSPELHHVLIGDSIHHKPFFKRTKKTSPVRTLEYVKKRCDENKMTLLLGNNENYILENLVTLEDKILKKETRYTLSCLRELDFDSRLELISWLARCPLTATIKSNKKIYRLGHGLYYDKSDKDKPTRRYFPVLGILGGKTPLKSFALTRKRSISMATTATPIYARTYASSTQLTSKA